MVTTREAKALAGIAAVMFGSAFAGQYIDTTYAPIVFGLLALAGGIVIIEQLPDVEAEGTA